MTRIAQIVAYILVVASCIFFVLMLACLLEGCTDPRMQIAQAKYPKCTVKAVEETPIGLSVSVLCPWQKQFTVNIKDIR